MCRSKENTQFCNFEVFYNQNEDGLLANIARTIEFPSIAGKAGGEDNPFGKEVSNCLEYVLHIGRNMGFVTNNVDNFVGEIICGSGEKLIGILCHADVVDAGFGWTTAPFKAEIIEGELYGRGSIDDKGPMVCCLYAMKYLKENHMIPENVAIKMIIGTDEEGDWISINEYLSRNPKLPEVSIVPDASFPIIYCEKGLINVEIDIIDRRNRKTGYEITKLFGGERNNIVPTFAKCEILCDSVNHRVELKTILERTALEHGIFGEIQYLDELKLLVCVKGKAAHAMTPEKGINAISYLMRLLKLASKQCRNGFAQQEIIDFYNRYISTEYDGKSMGMKCTDADSGELTVNVGLIEFIENKLKVSMNIRYPVTCNFSEIRKAFADVCAGGIASVKYGVCMEPIYFEKDGNLIQSLLEIYRSCTGDVDSTPIALGGATYARAIPNAVAFGPVFPGQDELAHEANEHYSISDYKRITEIYAKALLRLCEETNHAE